MLNCIHFSRHCRTRGRQKFSSGGGPDHYFAVTNNETWNRGHPDFWPGMCGATTRTEVEATDQPGTAENPTFGPIAPSHRYRETAPFFRPGKGHERTVDSIHPAREQRYIQPWLRAAGVGGCVAYRYPERRQTWLRQHVLWGDIVPELQSHGGLSISLFQRPDLHLFALDGL